jgi:hypothetical protein
MRGREEKKELTIPAFGTLSAGARVPASPDHRIDSISGTSKAAARRTSTRGAGNALAQFN